MDVSRIFHHLNMTPPPPPPSPSSPAASLPILAISILGILATTLLLFSYYLFVTNCLNWRRSYALSRRRTDPPSEAYSVQVFERRRGLEESAIQAIPTLRYRKISERGDAADDKAFHECAVCLNEFQEEERIRILPSCFHVFHVDCIDTWLQTHASCPLCRSSITTSSPIQARASMAAALQVPYDQDPLRNEDIVIEIGEDQGDAISERNSSRKLGQINSMGDEWIEAVRRSQDQQFKIEKPILWRSFSLDSSGDARQYFHGGVAAPSITTGESSGGGSTSNAATSSGRLRRSFFSFGRSSRGASVLPVQFEP